MGEQAILTALKVDLQISTSAMDTYLGQLITAAQSYISQEGITLTESVGDGILVEMYAAYLYRRRREENVQMTCWSWGSRSWSRMTSAILCRPGLH